MRKSYRRQQDLCQTHGTLVTLPVAVAPFALYVDYASRRGSLLVGIFWQAPDRLAEQGRLPAEHFS
jgi:hypothetical protein